MMAQIHKVLFGILVKISFTMVKTNMYIYTLKLLLKFINDTTANVIIVRKPEAFNIQLQNLFKTYLQYVTLLSTLVQCYYKLQLSNYKQAVALKSKNVIQRGKQ